MGLHPALARIAGQYDVIVRDFHEGRLSNADAHSRIAMLSARDDTGVFWSIDPASGSWLRKTAFGEWVPGSPPEYGLAQPTAFQLTGVHDAVGERLRFDKVDERLMHPPESIMGATRRSSGGGGNGSGSGLFADRKRVLAWSIVVVAAVLVALFVFRVEASAVNSPAQQWTSSQSVSASDMGATVPSGYSPVLPFQE